MERSSQKQTESIQDAYAELLKSEPKPVTNFVPEKQSALSQKDEFLAGEIRNPDHTYNRLDAIDFDTALHAIEASRDNITEVLGLDNKQSLVYEAFIDNYKKKTQLMSLAHAFKHTEEPTDREVIKREFMDLNIELYGEPDRATYKSLLSEKVSDINAKQLSESASGVRDELISMLDLSSNGEKIERFAPSDETIAWMHTVVDSLYGNMLAHIPEQDTFTAEEVQAIFAGIVEQEFGESASEWSVDIESAKAINVKSAERRIVIPEDRADISIQTLKSLVVHEIGVHMLRSVIGSDTDLLPLGNGLNEYYDAEEGLGVVMEQALVGEFSERGIAPYITAGLAHIDGKDFRDTFEVKWRLSLLGSIDDDEEVTEEAIIKAKNTAYSSVMRSMRGTDELPWFKDLAYYNGSMNMWRHLESIQGDDLQLTFVLMGKANPADAKHRRILYETKTN